MGVPVTNECLHQCERRLESLSSLPGSAHEGKNLRSLLRRTLGETKDSLIHILEVLVERRGRGTDVPGDIHHANLSHAALCHERRQRVEELVARLQTSRSDNASTLLKGLPEPRCCCPLHRRIQGCHQARMLNP